MPMQATLPFRLSALDGTVYGAALNSRYELDQLAERLTAPPYKEPPKAPILYIKPKNTHLAHGGTVDVPGTLPEIQVAATIAVLFERDATKVSAEKALDYVLGYTLALDLSEPCQDFYRPAIREKCRDGFLPIGPAIVPAGAIADPSALSVSVEIDGKVAATLELGTLVRSIPQLIADVSAFMTLRKGDVLLTGLTPGYPLVKIGSTLSATARGFARLDCTLAAEALP